MPDFSYWPRPLVASMGPRLGGRGDQPRRSHRRAPAGPASMGPRLGGRGDEDIDRYARIRDAGLQWGRGSVAAEMK